MPTPRTITDHKVNGLNEAIEITAVDAPGPGGANHRYELVLDNGKGVEIGHRIAFQNGPIGEAGFNGITNEALLAVLIDRMRGFQGMLPHQQSNPAEPVFRPDPAPFRSRENAIALTHLEEAMMWLQKRTRDRMARGVEGTHKV